MKSPKSKVNTIAVVSLLQFSSDGIVIDVLHKDHRYKLGHSALLYQYLADKDPMARTLGPGPDQ